jgi:Uma2 family endonuclease
MTVVHHDTTSVHIPVWVGDLASFRRWMHSAESPEKSPVFFLAGEVWVDMTKEQFFSHNPLKKTIALVLSGLETQVPRRFIPNGMLLTNEDADLSGNPDGAFVSTESFRSARVRLLEGADSGHVELEGSPDMVLEVVSDRSVEKDTEMLRDLYWKAGIREYWIADGRGDEVQFTILKHTARGYSSVRNTAGWLKSSVFGKSFRLTRRLDELGHPDFVLDVK